MPVWEADDVLSLDEVATALRLDRRTVRRVAFQLGGKRFGRRWRFRWGTVMELSLIHILVLPMLSRRSRRASVIFRWSSGRIAPLAMLPRRKWPFVFWAQKTTSMHTVSGLRISFSMSSTSLLSVSRLNGVRSWLNIYFLTWRHSEQAGRLGAKL